MVTGTLDRTPPPFFRQGTSARTKLIFFSALAVFLMVADARLKIAEPLRAGLASVLLPVQRVLAVPVDMVRVAGDYLRGLGLARAGLDDAQTRLQTQAVQALRAEQLARENERLRALLDLRPALAVVSTAAEVLYEAADPYSRKVIIDQGVSRGVVLGSPVINEAGVLGQVTHVYLNSAEVTLLTDKDAAIPVLNTRTQQRSAAMGGAAGIELRFTSANADVKVGDVLHTSGIDGVYPPGLAVARVAAVDRRVESGFARIDLTPAANPDGVRHVMVLRPTSAQLPPRPAAEAPRTPERPRSGASRPGSSP
jgi:rod shape-determining protein MreC